MTMPEAAVDKNHDPVLWKDNVWVAGQISSVEPEAIPEAMKQRPHRDFGSGVLGPHMPHDSTAFNA